MSDSEYKKRVKLPEMARLLSRSVRQFRRDVKIYQIPHLQLGSSKLFLPDEVERVLAAANPTEPVASAELKRSAKNNRILAEMLPDERKKAKMKYYDKLLGL